MDNLELWLLLIGNGILSLLTQPLLYLTLLLLMIIYMYRTKMERAMFSVRLDTWQKPFYVSILSGFTLAIIVSIISIVLGFTLTVASIWWVWAISMILLLFRLRFANIVYSAGIVVLLHLIAVQIGPLKLNGIYLEIYESLFKLQVSHIVIIASILALAQAVLIKLQGSKFLSPIYLSGKRGKVIGGYVLQAYWCAPLLLFMPVANDTELAVSFTTTAAQPFFLVTGPESWLLLAAPMMLGVTGVTYSASPAAFIQRIFKQRLLISLGLLAISLLSWWYDFLIWLAAIALIVSFEALHVINKWYESKQIPCYGPLDVGLKVLAVVKNSPAVHMGVVPGDVIKKANGKLVHSLDELYEAMSINPAFCKLEMINSDGEIKFAQRARYADEHHQLGIIMAPDSYSKYIEYYREPSIVTLFAPKKLRSNAKKIEAEISATV